MASRATGSETLFSTLRAGSLSRKPRGIQQTTYTQPDKIQIAIKTKPSERPSTWIQEILAHTGSTLSCITINVPKVARQSI